MNLSNIHSEVEKYSNRIQPGMKVYFYDGTRIMRYTVTEIDEWYITVSEDVTGEKETHSLSSLQYGWHLSQAALDFIEATRN
jgi:dihydrofolate reductase